ncbi:uncharacterized protein [Asterias amurensis]|uniref:uncharacterized protein n=1 Tax=Asterias amurensis TaxID=7602 RepID=UPI003AB719EA
MAVTRYIAGLLLVALVVNGQEFGDFQEPLSLGASLQQIHPFMGKLMNSNFPCEFCEDFFDFLLNVTTSKDTLDGIEQLLLTVCEWAPYVLYQECRNFAKQVPSIVDMLAKQYLNGSENCAPLCNKIGEGNRMQDAMNFMKLMNAIPMKRPEQKP